VFPDTILGQYISSKVLLISSICSSRGLIAPGRFRLTQRYCGVLV